MRELDTWRGASASTSAAERCEDSPFSFSSARRTLTAAGPGTPLPLTRGGDVAQQAALALASDSAPDARAVVAGAIAYNGERHPPRLRLHTVRHAHQHQHQQAANADQLGDSVFLSEAPLDVIPQPAAAHYRQAVRRALTEIQAGLLHKVVLARSLELRLRQPLALEALLLRLQRQNPGKYVFRCDLAEPRQQPRVLIGASPELLLSKQGPQVVSHPLAGSVPRNLADARDDELRARALMRSAKNLHEHAIVVEAVSETLTRECRSLHVPAAPSLVQTATMWHLGTKITGRLQDPECSSLSLALALHPTPAVCGTPQRAAARAIEGFEGLDRGYFGGIVGYCDGSGDGEWAVSIRCAEATATSLRLYAGAGIVADSDPHDELAETTAKLGTMLKALGFSGLERDC